MKRINLLAIPSIGLLFCDLVFGGLLTNPGLKLIAFMTIILLPGILIAACLDLLKAKTSIFTVGFGLATCMITSLAVNMVLPLFGVNDPLRLRYLLPAINLAIIILIIICLKKSCLPSINKSGIRSNFGSKTKRIYLLYFSYAILPLLAAGNAIRLNNQANNHLGLVLVVLLVINWVATLLVKTNKHTLIYWTLFISLNIVVDDFLT